MTQEEKISFVQTLVNNTTEATSSVLTVYLSLAENKIMNRLYPHGIPEDSELPSDYEYIQCELTSRLWIRRGGEGEISHNENGVNRTYGSVNDEDILSQIIPYAEVVTE